VVGPRSTSPVEAFRAVIARAADRPDIGMALVYLDEAAAAPGRRRIVAKEAEVLRFFGISGGHGASSLHRHARHSGPASGGPKCRLLCRAATSCLRKKNKKVEGRGEARH